METPLRKQAEEILKKRDAANQAGTTSDLNKLIHELQVHQIELELQNEELRRTHLELQESQRKYFEYFHQAPVSYLTLDRYGVIQEANLQARLVLGGDATHQLVGKPMIMHLQTSSHNIWIDHQDIIFEQQRNHSCELVIKHSDFNESRYIFLQSKPMKKNGQWLCWTAMSDITEQKVLEIALRRSQLRLQDAQHTAQIANWEYQLHTEDGYWSDELFRLLGYEPQAVAPSLAVLVNHIDEADSWRVEHAFRDALQGIQPINIDFRYRRNNGEVRSAHITSSQRILQDSEQPLIAGTFQDITDRKSLESEIIQLEVEKERINVLSQFINDASHEFRTPLSIIHSTCEMLNWEIPQGQVDPSHPEIIQEQVKRIEDLLVDLLLMSRIDAGTPLHLRIADINYLIKLTVDGMHSQIQSKGITLHTDLFDEVYLIKADEHLLGKAIGKVMHNAIRYSPSNSNIHIISRLSEDVIEIIVQDEGLGMNPETLSHATERFYRVDTAHATAGFGLGLPIAKKVVEAHNGQFFINSDDEDGTTVRIILPTSIK